MLKAKNRGRVTMDWVQELAERKGFWVRKHAGGYVAGHKNSSEFVTHLTTLKEMEEWLKYRVANKRELVMRIMCDDPEETLEILRRALHPADESGEQAREYLMTRNFSVMFETEK